MTTPDDDPRVEALLREAPTQDAEPLTRRDRLAESVIALALVGVTVAFALTAQAPATSTAGMALALGLLHLLARRVRFSIGVVTATPTLLAAAPMMLLLHPALAIGVIVVSGVLSRVPEYVRRRVHPDHMLLSVGDAWYAVGPLLVIALAGRAEVDLGKWPVYAAALVAMVIVDNLVTALRMWLALGVPPDLQLRLQILGFMIDGALAPIGLAMALVAADRPAAVL